MQRHWGIKNPTSYLSHKSFRTKELFLLLILISVHPNTLLNAQGKWECQNPWPTSADIMSIWPLSENKVIAGGVAGSLLISEDRGKSWDIKKLSTGNPIQRMFFTDSATGWITTGDKLLKSEDGGKSWNEVPTGINLAYHFFSDFKFITRDKGWLLITPRSTYYQDIIDHPGQAFETTDGGLTWLKSSYNFQGILYEVSCVDENNIFVRSSEIITQFSSKTFLYETSDGGISWQKLEGPRGGLGGGYLYFVDINIGWMGKYKTTDRGLTWVQKLDSSISLTGLEVVDKTNMWSNNNNTIYHSTDGGDTWETQSIEPELNLRRTKFFDKNIGWACGSGGMIHYTTDGGTNWIRSSKGAIDYLWGVDFADDKNGWAVGTSGRILHTVNGGTDWIEQDSGIKNDLAAVDFVDNKSGWAVGQVNILSTSDGGDHWISQKGCPDTVFTDVQFLNTKNGWVTGTSGILWKTNDGGTTWEPESTKTIVTLYDVNFVDSLYGWVCGQGGTILASTDGGIHWQKQSIASSSGFLKLQFVDRNHGWVTRGDAAVYYRTTDGGVTWTQLPPNATGYEGLQCFYFLDENIGFGCTFLNSDILITSDGGQTWSVEDRLPSNRISSLKFTKLTLGWAVGMNGTILKYSAPDTYVPNSQGNINRDDEYPIGFPNPFNSTMTIRFNLSEVQPVTITAFNILGESVNTVFRSIGNKGVNTIRWEPLNLASGIYLITINCRDYSKTFKCALLK